VNNYERDGFMTVTDNGGRSENYYPNSFDDIKADEDYKLKAPEVHDAEADWFDRNDPARNDDDHYHQPGKLYQIMDDKAKQDLIQNTVGAMSDISGTKKEEITQRQLTHWYKADAELGEKIAEGLGTTVHNKQ